MFGFRGEMIVRKERQKVHVVKRVVILIVCCYMCQDS